MKTIGMKKISIMGATGSVGRSTADVILAHPDMYDVQAVTAYTKAEELARLAKALKAKRAVVGDPAAYDALKEALAGTPIEAAAGPDALLEAASMPADIVMAAIVGMTGLLPVLKAIEQGRCVAIANKEPLVSAGRLVIEAARKYGATLLPVDSEHNAIFQVFDATNRAGIDRIVLTASGGPFRTWSAEQMRAATPEQAVAHPNWSMGAKISVDSASMMNKALEVIEARWLFDLPAEKIDVLVHPQSVVHSMVEYNDGSVLAQLGAADMRTPIAYALGYPDRIVTPGRRLDLAALSALQFFPPDHERFPALKLAYECLRSGEAACIAFNAANEVAVQAFLDHRLSFTGIVETVAAMLDKAGDARPKTLEEILLIDQTVRSDTDAYITQNTKKAG
jgi:1-deoxy-D-xylulose-5-phosphate reductoisomerase